MPGISRANELRAERKTLQLRQGELLDRAESENRDLNAEEEAEFDRIHDEQNLLLKRAERIEQHERDSQALEDSRGVVAGRQDTDDSESREVDQDGEDAESRAFWRWVRYGQGSLSAEERSIMAGRYAAGDPESRAQGTNVDTAGGYVAPPEFSNRVVEAMLAFGGMRASRATVLTTGTGNPLPIPTSDDTSNTGAIIAENPGSQTEQDVSFGQVVLNSYTYTSKMIRVSLEFLQDAAIDVPGFLSRALGTRIGRITNTHFTTGDGASKPTGIAATTNGSTLGVTGATGQTSTIIYDDLVDLEHSVDPSYRPNAQWMARDPMIQVIKKLKDGEGRPLWLPGLAVNAPDTILGYGYVVNQDIATPAASALSLFFGDWSLYHIRDVRGITLRRLDERYAELNQVAFLAFSRHDGILVDAGTNPIKHYAHPAS